MSTWRRDYITRFIFGWAKGVLPTLSATEREAIEAGDVWWDADLFTGNPGLVETAGDARRQNYRPTSRPSSTARSKNSAPCSTSGTSPGNCATCRRTSGTS